MSHTITITYTDAGLTGRTLYATVQQSKGGPYWNGTAYETYNASDWSSYVVALTEQTAGAGDFAGDVPAGVTDASVWVTAYRQLGASRATADPVVAGGWVQVPGASLLRRSLVAALTGSAAVTAVVGTNVFPGHTPQTDSLPSLLYAVISDVPGHDLAGPFGIARARVRLTCASKTFADCETLAEACRALLDGFTGTLGGGVTVTETLMLDAGDSDEPPPDGSDDWTFMIRPTFAIHYRQSTPNRG